MQSLSNTIRALEGRLRGDSNDGTLVVVCTDTAVSAMYHLRRLSDVTPKSRAGNPDTSRKAAKKAATGQGRQHTAILVALDMLGGAGTVEDINVKAGTIKVGWWTADKHRIGKRMSELVRLGLAERTGEERDGFGIYRLTRKES